MKSICGIDCEKCELKDTCKGCVETNGHPFGGDCIVAKCFEKGENTFCALKSNLLKEINSLGIEDMEEVRDLNALKGDFVNLEYTLPNGQVLKLLNDNDIYLGNQVYKKGNAERCYGICANEKFIIVSEYGENGIDAEVIRYVKR